MDEAAPFLVINEKFTNRTPYSDEIYLLDEESLSGTFYELIKLLSKNLNFTYTLYRRHDNNWGRNINGSWNGMIGNILKGDVDILGSSFTYSLERYEVIDYIFPMVSQAVGLFIHDSGLHDGFAWELYFKPFSWSVWGSLLVITICVSLFYRLLKFFVIGKHELDVSKNVGSFVKYSFGIASTFFGGVFPYTNSTLLKREPLRLMTLLTLFCGNVVWLAYQASLSSSFTVKKTELPFDSWETLHLDSNYR